MSAAAPAAYTFNADIYGPECIVEAMISTDEYEGWGLAPGVSMSVEENLDEIAAAFSIDRSDETSFDSDAFPKAVFSHQLNGECCGQCGEEI
ncbi:hypothetical protein [Arthrobacter caoxuetaonis]|uniref:Uncharacterized protein n=1 Tax=Arthrobacter caoxuetaonis TaxID=2886935 RepID=A0A9X1MH59_9MICC|nr:hypothetical protein [Arthrobacter caoxuetaonis]MCC3299736.1 hypothetical protein [Arthrobacter caoxuetaonis]USQ59362.1 hypothetical protein NF551_17480 [Arthrobacter caoxuetaonis]